MVSQTRKKELREGLGELGYVEGRSIAFEFRSAEGKLDRLRELADELVRLKVDVIVALYVPCALAAKRATREIPIVIIAADAVETGIVASLAHPGDPKLLCLSLLRSLRFDLSGANDLAPFLGIFCDHGGEIGRGPRQYNARHVGNPRLDCRIGEGGINRFIEFIDDLGRRIFGRADPVPRACLVAGDKVGNWSKVGQSLQARRARNSQCPELACSDVPD